MLSSRESRRPASSQTQTITTTEEVQPSSATPQQPQQLVLHLAPRPPQQPQPVLRQANPQQQQDQSQERRVTFTPDTIDNEHLGRLKSNCCCIWVPQRRWDDPSTWTPDEHETEHCRGHTLPPPPPPQKKPDDDDGNGEDGSKNNNNNGGNGHGPGCC